MGSPAGDAYARLIATYGHRAVTPKPYTTSAFIAGVLGRLAAHGALRLTFDTATGYWSYNEVISYWAAPGVERPMSRLTWAQFASDEGIDPSRWPLLQSD